MEGRRRRKDPAGGISLAKNDPNTRELPGLSRRFYSALNSCCSLTRPHVHGVIVEGATGNYVLPLLRLSSTPIDPIRERLMPIKLGVRLRLYAPSSSHSLEIHDAEPAMHRRDE